MRPAARIADLQVRRPSAAWSVADDLRRAERHARGQSAPRRPQGERRQDRAFRRARARAARGAGPDPREPSAARRRPSSVDRRPARASRGGAKASSTACASPEDVDAVLERFGAVPLPPYIRHAPQAEDAERYQTVYAAVPGAVAAPTAGLHFDEEMLEESRSSAALPSRKITLHVGFGTFQPVRGGRGRSSTACTASATAISAGRLEGNRGQARARGRHHVAARARGGRATGRLEGETDLFIYPGFQFRVVKRLLTNFHLPKSTLLMLVSRVRRASRTSARPTRTRSPSATGSSPTATRC